MASPAAVLEILVTANSGQATASLARVDESLRNTQRTAQSSSHKIATAAKYSGIALAGIGAVSTKLAVDFEKSMRNVNSLAKLPEPQFQKLEKRVLGLAGKTAQAPKTLADGLYDLVSSGFDANESIKILHKSAIAATAGMTDTATATKGVAAVLNAYHLKAKDAGKVSDTLFQTVNYGVLTFEDLASTIGDTLPFASSLGVKLKEVGAATATMTKQGLSSSETMTRIRNVMQTMIKPGKDLKGTFDDLNTTGEDLIKQYGFQGALEKLVSTTDGTKEAVAQLFPNIRALGGVLALTGGNASSAEQDLKKMSDTSGATAKVFGEQSKSFAVMWQQFTANAQAAAIKLGQQILPDLKDVLGIITDPKLTLDEKFKAIGDKMADVIKEWGPKIATAATHLGIALAKGLVGAFLDAPVLGQLAIGGWLLTKFGGAQAFSDIGAKAGKWFSVALIAGIELQQIGKIVSGEMLDATTREMKATELEKVGYTAVQFVGKGMITALGPDGNFNVFRQKQGEWVQQTVDNFKDWDKIPKLALKNGQEAFDNWDKVLGNITDKGRDQGQKFHSTLSDAYGAIPHDAEDKGQAVYDSWAKWLGKTAKTGGEQANKLKGAVVGSVWSMAGSVADGFKNIGANTNSLLKSFDIDMLAFAIKSGAQGAKGYQTGGAIVPGYGSGDKVPAMLEPGEVVLNRKAVAAMGGPQKTNQINQAFPRFQKGGIAGQVAAQTLVGPPGILKSIGQAALDLVRNAANKYVDSKKPAPTSGAVGTGGPGPGGVGSWMGVPMANWVIASLKYAASKGVSPQPTSGYRSHAYNVAQGRTYYSEHEGTVYPHGAVDFGGYHDPVALANKMAVVHATSSYKWPLLAPIGFVDDGHASGTGHMRGGIIQKLRGGGEVVGRAIPKKLQKYNHVWAAHQSPDYSGPTMPVNDIAMLAEFFGMPGITMAQIAHGESGYRPGAWGIDPNGVTRGYGLWAITSPYNDAVVNQLGGYMQMLNPIKNAIAASKAYKARGVAPWYGTRYMTGTNLHWNGDFGSLVSAAHPDHGGSGGSGGQPKPPAYHTGPNDVNPLWWMVLNPTAPPGGYPSAWGNAFLRHLKLPEKLRLSIQDSGHATQMLSDMINTATTIAGFSYSPSGEDLSPDERANLIGLEQAYIGNLYDRQAKLQKGLDWLNSASPLRPKLLDQLNTIQGAGDGSIAAAFDVLYKLQNPASDQPVTTTDTSQLPDGRDEQIALLKSLLTEANQRTAVSQLQYGVFKDYAGMFGMGGKIAAGQWGIAGERGPEIVTGPAQVYTPGQASGLATVVVNGDIVNTPPGVAPVEINGARAVVQQGSRGLGRRPMASSLGR